MNLPDFGDWGNGPDDPYTKEEDMRRVYFSFNAGTMTVVGTCRVPPSWTLARVRRHGMFAIAQDLTVSRDMLDIKATYDALEGL